MQPLFLCLTENLNYALGWMVLHSLWQATLMAFVVGFLNIFLRKRSAQWRYWVSNVSLLLILGMSIATFCNHYDFTKEPNHIRLIPVRSETQAQVVATLQDLNNIANQSPLSIEAFKDYFNHNLPLIVTFWILGVALFMLKLLGGLSYIFYLKKHMNFPTDEYWKDMMEELCHKAGISKSIELVESALVKTPIVVGYFKPMILFPMGIINRLSPEEVEAILAHELAHVLRHDYLFNILQSVVEALFYYHPAVWWLSNQIRNERESACDEIAIDLINNKLNYAKALVTVQEMAHYPLLPALGFVTQDVMTQNAFAGQRKNQFILRMQRILNVPQNKSNIMEKLIATFLIVIALVGLSIAQNKKENKSSDKTETPQYTEQNKDKTSETTSTYETFSNITTIGDTIGNPFYTTLPPTPEILKLQSELVQMEKEYPVFVKEREAYIEKLKAELAEMEGGIASFEKQKEVEIAQVEKEIAEMNGNMPKAEKNTNANIAAILENIKKKEAELEVFIKTVEAENSKIEAQIAEKKKESEGKTSVKRSRVDGEIQGLYGQIQGNLGEIQGRRGEIQGMYGEIQGLKGEMMGNKGEIQGRQGEIMGKRGEVMGRRGEIQGKRGEIQGVRGEMMGKMGQIQGKRGEIQGKYSELVLKSLIADLKSDKVITEDNRLHLKLNQKSMIVNDVKLSDELHAKYKAKYLKDNNRGFEIYKRNGNLNFTMDNDEN